MKWKDICYRTLDHAHMFHDSDHANRFQELIDCYAEYPFFSPNLCKCMYLAAWDEQHFADLLQMLNMMTLGREKDTAEMEINGSMTANEETTGEAFMYRLSVAFLEDSKIPLEEVIRLNDHYQYLVGKALQAASLIDSIPIGKDD